MSTARCRRESLPVISFLIFSDTTTAFNVSLYGNRLWENVRVIIRVDSIDLFTFPNGLGPLLVAPLRESQNNDYNRPRENPFPSEHDR